MAYNNGFPINYPQYYAQNSNLMSNFANFPQNQNLNGQNVQQNSIIWVQGEAGAKSYLVAPNTTVQLWDSESQVIYLKSADASGMPSIKVLDYTIRSAEHAQGSPLQTQGVDYTTKSDLDAIWQEIQALQKRSSVRKEKKDESTVRNDE